MCGIAGYISEDLLDGQRMIEVISHRGPDSSSTYHIQRGRHNVFLGHQRLSIIDLSDAGRQPMSTPGDEVTITFNGEIYNYNELRAQYLRGYEFRSKTDTEVLLYLYLEFGNEFVHLLNGDFAIALWDQRLNRLLLVRDRLGVKPLYYYHQNGTFAFGSEVKALLAADLSVSLSQQSLQKYFVFKYVPGNGTLHNEIKRLEPGCMAEYRPETDSLNIHRYWAPAFAPTRLSYADAKSRLYELLEDSVRLRLVADVPVGTFLSGGVDSSAIASYLKNEPHIVHYCARKEAKDLRAEGTTSDYHYARRLANAWGITLYPADIGSAEATRDRIRQTSFFSDDLIADGSQIPSYLITQEASRSAKVMLSGMGADELFLGYAGHMLTLLALYADKLPKSLRQLSARLSSRLDQGNGVLKAYRRYLHKFGKYYGYQNLRYAAFSIVGDFENSLRVCRFDDDTVSDFLAAYFSADEDPFESITRFELSNFLVKNLHYFDRMCMANSVEGRVPFMDHRVVEFALSIPRSYKLSAGGRSKRILKDTFSEQLPSYILKRRKAGFGMPLRSIFGDRKKVDGLLDLDFFDGYSMFDVDHIRRLILSHIEGREDNSSIIYALVSFQEWHRLFHEEEIVA